jgi:putative PIN family toxin of toxin-antitoxin system
VKIILDTNVFISGVFFTGPPYQILKAWCDGKVQLVISQEILGEYQRVGETLAQQFPGIDLGPILELLTVKAELILAPGLPEPVCDDTDDDKFLACALASKAKLIVSGDKHLLRVSGYRGIVIVSPRKFIDEYLI